jgi:hypothetical protein
MKQLRYKAVEQSTLSSPLRILAVADGKTASGGSFPVLPAPGQHFSCTACLLLETFT